MQRQRGRERIERPCEQREDVGTWIVSRLSAWRRSSCVRRGSCNRRLRRPTPPCGRWKWPQELTLRSETPGRQTPGPYRRTGLRHPALGLSTLSQQISRAYCKPRHGAKRHALSHAPARESDAGARHGEAVARSCASSARHMNLPLRRFSWKALSIDGSGDGVQNCNVLVSQLRPAVVRQHA